MPDGPMTSFPTSSTGSACPDARHDPMAIALLNRIRFSAAACRTSARLDLFDACAVLESRGHEGEQAHVATLIRVLGQALGTRPVFRRAGATGLSFDEAWLLATINARTAGDDASFTFLVNRRVAASKRRIFALLVSGLAERLSAMPQTALIDKNLTRAPTHAGVSC